MSTESPTRPPSSSSWAGQARDVPCPGAGWMPSKQEGFLPPPTLDDMGKQVWGGLRQSISSSVRFQDATPPGCMAINSVKHDYFLIGSSTALWVNQTNFPTEENQNRLEWSEPQPKSPKELEHRSHDLWIRAAQTYTGTGLGRHPAPASSG